MVSFGNHCVVFDTVIEHLPSEFHSHRPWDVGDNAMTAMRTYRESDVGSVIDREMDAKLQISVVRNGYLRRIF